MRIHLIVGLAAALALSACVFSSQQQFFTEAEAAHPFGDGSRYRWVEDGDSENVLVFHHNNGAYDIDDVAGDEEDGMRNVLFVAVTETPEEDYILQWPAPDRGIGVAYAFVWRRGDSYRIASSPSGLFGRDDGKPSRADAYCTWRAYRECALASREELLRLYRELIYPQIASGAVLAETVELRPLAGGQNK